MSRKIVGLLFLTALTLAALVIHGHGSTAVAQNDGGNQEVDQGPTGPGLVRHPLFLKVFGRDSSGRLLVTNPSPRGYTPAQIQAYLGLAGDGSGQTIAIVDAFDDPNVVNDLNTFSSTFGLPLICGTSGADPLDCVNFTTATPQGLPRTDSGWSLEISLDVEWAHSVAPKAEILLVEAASNSYSNLMAAIDYAAQHGAAVISNSWGSNEFGGETAYDYHCNLPAAVCTFSSGDSGNPGGYPGYSPYVVTVGGTTLTLTSSGAVVSEKAWNGSGGGVSQYESKPAYQNGVNSYSNRGMPDVSYDADPNTGFAVYDTVRYLGQSGWFQVGGTSAGAPQWAAIIAVSDQLRAAGGQRRLTAAEFQTNTELYGLLGSSAIFDVTSGSNGNCGSICTAALGYDFVTGLGSPRTGIDTALAGTAAAPTPTPTPTPGTPTSTPTATSTPAATNTPIATSTPPPGTATATPSATPTTCPPGWHKRGLC
jgi:subtilase family serine protease